MSYKNKNLHNVIEDFIYNSLSPAEQANYEKVAAFTINEDQSVTFTETVAASDVVVEETVVPGLSDLIDQAIANVKNDGVVGSLSTAPNFEVAKSDDNQVDSDYIPSEDKDVVLGSEVDTAQSTADVSPDQTKAPAKPKAKK